MNVRLSGRAFLFAVFGVMSIASLPCSADSVIVATTSPRYLAGQVVAAGQPVQLAPGEKLKLLSAEGKTLVLEGAYSGPAEEPGTVSRDRSVTRALATLLRQPRQDTSTVGAFRSARPRPQPSAPIADDPDTVLVDIRRSGTHCVAPGQKIRIARPPFASTDQLTLSDPASGRSETLAWDRDGNPADWPAAWTLGEGLSVLARIGTLGGPVRLELRPVQFDTEDPGERAVQLIRMDCLAQAKPLIDQLRADGI